MGKIKKVIKDNNLFLDLLNVILGIILVIFIVLILIHPTNTILLKLAFGIGGLMNILNSYKIYKQKKTPLIALSLFMIGLIVIFCGVFLIGA
ncbi:hypothetical protein [Anaeromicropila herbilytica]|uniref:Uncharacterized protein n=1 Tax=Anaeromicropila herbilytica TaxID=2785025 RepID=A0A7R7EJ65_9FIRM|nr:hypothetical protein [Anaeromicropila herbilytica]BCN29699.1 hypothetical protein bsdtb5_09940 [Anaeromicropila herbilytica]